MNKQKKKSKKINRCDKNTNNYSEHEKKSSYNKSNKSANKTSKLCTFSSTDYIVLASTLAIALGEELSSDDVNILASFFAVLSDELALIAAVNECNSNDENSSVFIPPVPDVATTSSRSRSRHIKKKK